MNELSLIDYTSIYETSLKKGKNQQLLTKFLREHNFNFFHNYTLKEMGIELNLKPEHEKLEVGLLIRNDEPDKFLFYVFHLMHPRSSSIYIYMNGQYYTTIHKPLANANHNFRKPLHGFKFPAYMTYDERKEWRAEFFKLKKGKIKETSEFYKEHEPEILILKK